LSDDVANCSASITRTQQLVQNKIQQQDTNDDSLTESTHSTHSLSAHYESRPRLVINVQAAMTGSWTMAAQSKPKF